MVKDVGGRGAASGMRYRLLRNAKDGEYGYEPYGKKYGSEFKTVLQVGDIKFVKNKLGSTTPPAETRAGSGRIYVTLTKKNEPKHITFYGKNGQRLKQIDLFGPAHTVNGKKVPTPHTHLGYLHLEGGTRERMTAAETKIVEKVLRIWENNKGKL